MKLSIGMINMYIDLVNEMFAPLLTEIKVFEQAASEKASILAKKDAGIYDIMMEKETLIMRMREIDDEIMKWQRRYRDKSGEWTTDLEILTENHLRKVRVPQVQAIKDARDEAIRSIKLSGLSGEIKMVFDKLPETVKKLSMSIKKLPKAQSKLITVNPTK